MNFEIGDLSYPIIATAIHDGHDIRDELKDHLLLGEAERLREEDPYTGAWVSLSKNTVVVNSSRFEVDLNRIREKAVYIKPEDAWGLKVWKGDLPVELIQNSLNKYDTFYNKMNTMLDKFIENNKHVIIYDLHSYNYKRNGRDKPAEDDILNPELNLGTGTLNRDRWGNVIDRFLHDMSSFDFLGRNLDVRENIKFKGGGFPRWVHQNYPDNVCCLSIEFRKFFMDEWSGTPDHKIISEIGKALKYSTNGAIAELNKLKSN